MKILGAGLSGLLAAHTFPAAELWEAAGPDKVPHRALLRFRSGAVGEAVGVEFQRVRVHKGIWLDGRFVQPDIRTANWYSQKVAGQLLDRSVWNVEAVDRFIAPDDFVAQLTHSVRHRIHWRAPVTELTHTTEPTISTIPMPALAGILGTDQLATQIFRHAEIYVTQFRVAFANVYQTVYFPSPATAIYRASITGSTLIVESVDADIDVDEVCQAFGLSAHQLIPLHATHEQRYGKISPIDDAARRYFIQWASHHHNVYALGRFAIWKNVLMDDVLHDVAIIKRLLQTDTYGRNLLNGAN